jgi:hypothetical protein
VFEFFPSQPISLLGILEGYGSQSEPENEKEKEKEMEKERASPLRIPPEFEKEIYEKKKE